MVPLAIERGPPSARASWCCPRRMRSAESWAARCSAKRRVAQAAGSARSSPLGAGKPVPAPHPSRRHVGDELDRGGHQRRLGYVRTAPGLQIDLELSESVRMAVEVHRILAIAL